MIYRTWYTNFSAVKTVTDATLAAYPLGGNVKVRPGTVLIKVVSDPKVYAVEPGGVLRWVTSASLAAQLYGQNWSKLVRDLDVSFFSTYTIGESISTYSYPVGTVLKNAAGERYLVVREAGVQKVRRFGGEAFGQNRFDPAFVITTSFSILAGSDITGAEKALYAPAP
ncbi:hypothetical protein EPN90_01245 [Patescibacteria group bacterium]|nr:MAG: hypothetical protein EPN90_01245 [Patescibacteria group bacterium]